MREGEAGRRRMKLREVKKSRWVDETLGVRREGWKEGRQRGTKEQVGESAKERCTEGFVGRTGGRWGGSKISKGGSMKDRQKTEWEREWRKKKKAVLCNSLWVHVFLLVHAQEYKKIFCLCACTRFAKKKKKGSALCVCVCNYLCSRVRAYSWQASLTLAFRHLPCLPLRRLGPC